MLEFIWVGLFFGNASDIQEWLLLFFGCVFPDRWGGIAAIMWSLWKNRNQVVWENKRALANFVASVMSLLQAWLQVNVRDAEKHNSYGPEFQSPIWVKPDVGWFKINVDAAVFEFDGAVSAAVRNWNGLFMGGFVRRHQGVIDPTVLELLTIREALSWLKERNKSYYIVESYCLMVVTWIKEVAKRFY